MHCKLTTKKKEELEKLTNIFLEAGIDIGIFKGGTEIVAYPKNESSWSVEFHIDGTWHLS